MSDHDPDVQTISVDEHHEVCLEFQRIDGTYECRCDVVVRAALHERARLRRSVETLGGYVRKSDEYVPVGVILMLLSDKKE